MRHTYKTLLASLLLAFAAGELRAQDPQFTQFYANPIYLNPALAGSKICPRFNLNYRNQWPGISGTYVTTGFSYDQLIHRLKGGIGITVMSDKAGQGTLNTTGIGVTYANKINPNRFLTISTALQAGYWSKSVDWSKLNFGDMIDPRRGFIYNTNEVPGVTQHGNFDIAAGMLISTDKYYIGGAVHHITEPDEGLLGYSKLPRKFTLHAGGNIPLHRNDKSTYLSPNILFMKQQDFQELLLGMYVKKDAIVGGLWYRNSDSFIILLGVEQGLVKIGYSYDVTISKLTNATAGSHELSLGLQLGCKPPPKRYRPVSCPSF